MKVTIVVVTYNRKKLLLEALERIAAQTAQPASILVVDNASSDGTQEALRQAGWLSHPGFKVLTLDQNTGGAGGFAAGMRKAVDEGADWIWIMDDDAMPEPDALRELIAVATDQDHIYGSVALQNDKLSWPMVRVGGGPNDTIYDHARLPELLDVSFIPFLGLLVSARTIEKIGLPDADYFIAADDVEYCLRARTTGARVLLVKKSRLQHPAAENDVIQLGWRPFSTLRLPPWKRYYDTRNRLLTAKRHYGAALYYSTIPGSFLRYFITLARQKGRWKQTVAFFGGMVDGLAGRKGRRHERWGLTP